MARRNGAPARAIALRGRIGYLVLNDNGPALPLKESRPMPEIRRGAGIRALDAGEQRGQRQQRRHGLHIQDSFLHGQRSPDAGNRHAQQPE